jgi:hypothetical protein
MDVSNENIKLNLVDNSDNINLPDNEDSLLELFNKLDNHNILDYNNSINISQIINYGDNFTLKDIMIICDYYGIAKDIKSNKCNKQQTIEILVQFETCINNFEIVAKRKRLWFYMNELKKDKFIKKYILW